MLRTGQTNQKVRISFKFSVGNYWLSVEENPYPASLVILFVSVTMSVFTSHVSQASFKIP